MQVADDFTAWLEQADIPESCRTEELDALLRAVFRFRQEQGTDYYSTRLLSHFLLNCDTGLKVAVIARLLGIARPTASRQQNLSSKEAIGQAHHRMDGRRRTDRPTLSLCGRPAPGGGSASSTIWPMPSPSVMTV